MAITLRAKRRPAPARRGIPTPCDAHALLPLQAEATFPSMTVVVNGRDDFTLENYRRVSEGGEPVTIGPRAREVMAAARADFIRLLDSDRTQFIYGVTSSFGPRVKVTIPPEQQRSHAQGVEFRGNWARGFGGDYLDEHVVRGIIFARLANFVTGHSKARPVIAERLAALLDGPLPPVPLDGQVGAGEVLPLAHVLRDFPRDDVEEGEGNPVVNGSPVSAALAADAALRAASMLDRAERVLALSAAAFGVPVDTYAQELGELWGDEDEAAALAALRRHLSSASPGRRPAGQVPASYLILGRVLGQAHRGVAGLTEAARVSLRSVTDNPVYLPPDAAHPLGQALSTGGFHNAMAYPALNALAAVWADLTVLVGWHVSALRADDPAAGPGSELSALAEEARAAAMPTLLPAAVNDPQDDVSSPVFGAYRREVTAAQCLDGALSLLAVEASRALDAAGSKGLDPA